MDDSIIDGPLYKAKPKKFSFIGYFIWSFLLIIGIIFRTQHWPFGGLISIISYAGLFTYSIIGLFFFKKKDVMVYLYFILSSSLLTWIIYGALFNNGNPYNSNGLFVYFSSVLILSVIYYLIYNRKKFKD